MYVGITGTIGSGKGEVVRILRRHGFTHYGFGDLLRAEAKARGVPATIEGTRAFANELRAKHGPDYLAKLLLRRCEAASPKHAVFESIRTMGELRALKQLSKFILISVDAPREVRYERVVSRGRGDGIESFEAFCAAEDAQLDGASHEQQLLAVMDEADIKVVNIDNLEELEAQIREALNI